MVFLSKGMTRFLDKVWLVIPYHWSKAKLINREGEREWKNFQWICLWILLLGLVACSAGKRHSSCNYHVLSAYCTRQAAIQILRDRAAKKTPWSLILLGGDKQNEYIIIREFSIFKPNFYKTKRYLHFITVTIQIHWLHTPESNCRKGNLLTALAQKNLVRQVLKESKHRSHMDQEYPCLPN